MSASSIWMVWNTSTSNNGVRTFTTESRNRSESPFPSVWLQTRPLQRWQGIAKESLCWAVCALVLQFPDATLHLHRLKHCLITCIARYLTVKTIHKPITISLDTVIVGCVGYCRLIGQCGQVFLHWE